MRYQFQSGQENFFPKEYSERFHQKVSRLYQILNKTNDPLEGIKVILNSGITHYRGKPINPSNFSDFWLKKIKEELMSRIERYLSVHGNLPVETQQEFSFVPGFSNIYFPHEVNRQEPFLRK